MSRLTGKVSKFISNKGFGFITPDDEELDDIFVHYKEIETDRKGYKNLTEGQSVSFDVEYVKDKPQARNVMIHPDDRSSKYERGSCGL